jgi:hypothetical protein
MRHPLAAELLMPAAPSRNAKINMVLFIIIVV